MLNSSSFLLWFQAQLTSASLTQWTEENGLEKSKREFLRFFFLLTRKQNLITLLITVINRVQI